MAPTILTLLGLLLTAHAPAPTFHEDFANATQAHWRFVSGDPKVITKAAKVDGPYLQLPPGAKAMLSASAPVQDFVVEARVRFAEKRGWVEAPFLLRANADGSDAIQVYLEQTGNQVMAVRLGAVVATLGSSPSPVALKLGDWYTVKIVALNNRVAVWVDGKPALMVTDPEPRAGCIGIRVGDARTDYASFTLRPVNERERKQVNELRISGREAPKVVHSTLALPDGATAVLRHPDYAIPLMPFEVSLSTDASGTYAITTGADEQSASALVPGQTTRLTFEGRLGARRLTLLRNGKAVGSVAVEVRAQTGMQANAPDGSDRYTAMYNLLRSTVMNDRSYHPYQGGQIQCNPTWVRDHIHEMKAYKYWEKDLTSFIDALIKLQHPRGYYYEILTNPSDMHLTFVKEPFRLKDRNNNIGWVRLEIEADVEYLMVEGAYAIWQATGDMRAMKARLPSLERALLYCYTDPTRWDSQHGALKRPFTPDTWDFVFGQSDSIRYIDDKTPMGIMHGDNSGLYAASRQLATMLRAAGYPSRAQAWDDRAEKLRGSVNKLCFNGDFYTHYVLLQPVNTGADETKILSLSNPYDINRGLPTHEMAVRIIDEYQRRRELRKQTHFAEWFSLDPAYPVFGPYPAGQYINGGVASFTAGELAKAALTEGREAYGVDILNRLAAKTAEDKAIYFLYTPEGKNQGGGPSGWGAAAVLSALTEGLAGIHDDTAQFKQVTISPRFAAAGIADASVCLRYGPTGAYMAMRYLHSDKRITIQLQGVAQRIHMRVLLPEGATEARLEAPNGMQTRIETVESSHYLVFDLPKPGKGVTNLSIGYNR